MSFEQSRSSKYKEESKRIQGQQQQESGRAICFPNFRDFRVNAYVFVEELLKNGVILNHRHKRNRNRRFLRLLVLKGWSEDHKHSTPFPIFFSTPTHVPISFSTPTYCLLITQANVKTGGELWPWRRDLCG